jgi:hypothetical protein
MFKGLFRRSPDLSGVQVVFVSKDDCHLCDVALETVRKVQARHPFRLEIVKIEKGDGWYDRYWDKIPVVLINGRMGFKYRVDPEELLAKLRASVGGEESQRGDTPELPD